MILKTYMEEFGPGQRKFRYRFCDLEGQEIASATNDHEGLFLLLTYGAKEFSFSRKIKRIEKPEFFCCYPLTSAKKTVLGYQVFCNDTVRLQSYREGLTISKKWILKRNISFTVYQYQSAVYHCFHVGFSEERVHYYCVMTPQGQTVGIIVRHPSPKDDCRATIYVKDTAMEELIMLVCANETMMVYTTGSGADRRYLDESAGHYISLTDAEKSLYDKNFIPAVKAMHGIYD